MSTISHRRQAEIGTAPTESPAAGAPSTAAFRYVIAAIRLSLGWIFLWAFLDKLFGLGHETAAKAAWIHGGHPTLGFLKFIQEEVDGLSDRWIKRKAEIDAELDADYGK